MDKTTRKIVGLLVIVYLILFPFGQIIRWGITIGSSILPLHPVDFVVGIIFVAGLIKRFRKPAIFRHIKNFIYLASFSLLFSVAFFKLPASVLGGLYLLRLIAYSYLFLAVFNISGNKKKWFNFLLGISVAIGVFGWFQYFFYPDVRALYAWGWDDHLLRMVGTFLDPTFTAIILTFGFILSVSGYLFSKKKRFLLLGLFFLVSVAFTYTRAAYLALIFGSLTIFVIKKNIKLAVSTLAAFILIVLLLPSGPSEGVRLERTYSIFSRLENYKETITIIGKSPLLGIGYNDLCLARTIYLGSGDSQSHSCSGSDSGPLFVLATTGILGLLVFLKLIKEIVKNISSNLYATSFLGSGLALLVHGLFANSYFYPWVMGFMAILLAISLKEKTSA